MSTTSGDSIFINGSPVFGRVVEQLPAGWVVVTTTTMGAGTTATTRPKENPKFKVGDFVRGTGIYEGLIAQIARAWDTGVEIGKRSGEYPACYLNEVLEHWTPRVGEQVRIGGGDEVLLVIAVEKTELGLVATLTGQTDPRDRSPSKTCKIYVGDLVPVLEQSKPKPDDLIKPGYLVRYLCNECDLHGIVLRVSTSNKATNPDGIACEDQKGSVYVFYRKYLEIGWIPKVGDWVTIDSKCPEHGGEWFVTHVDALNICNIKQYAGTGFERMPYHVLRPMLGKTPMNGAENWNNRQLSGKDKGYSDVVTSGPQVRCETEQDEPKFQGGYYVKFNYPNARGGVYQVMNVGRGVVGIRNMTNGETLDPIDERCLIHCDPKTIAQVQRDRDAEFWEAHRRSWLARNCPVKAEKPPVTPPDYRTEADKKMDLKRLEEYTKAGYLRAKIKGYDAQLRELEVK